MFRVIFFVVTFFSSVLSAQIGPVNCAQLTPEDIIDAVKVLSPNDLGELASRCADQRDLFMVVADEQTDHFERTRYTRYSLRAGIASQQLFESLKVTRR